MRIPDMNIIERTALWYRLDRIGQEDTSLIHPVLKPAMTEKEYFSDIKSELATCKKELLIMQSQINALRFQKKKDSKKSKYD